MYTNLCSYKNINNLLNNILSNICSEEWEKRSLRNVQNSSFRNESGAEPGSIRHIWAVRAMMLDVGRY